MHVRIVTKGIQALSQKSLNQELGLSEHRGLRDKMIQGRGTIQYQDQHEPCLVIADGLKIQTKRVLPVAENFVLSFPVSSQSVFIGLCVQITSVSIQPTHMLNPASGDFL